VHIIQTTAHQQSETKGRIFGSAIIQSSPATRVSQAYTTWTLTKMQAKYFINHNTEPVYFKHISENSGTVRTLYILENWWLSFNKKRESHRQKLQYIAIMTRLKIHKREIEGQKGIHIAEIITNKLCWWW
jgi:hypothetical protein